MARAISSAVASDRVTVVVNVGDDDYMYGAHVAADLDTVTYTLAGIQGPHGWGIADDTFFVMEEMSRRGIDASFRLGDRDLATCLYRTAALSAGKPLSTTTAKIARSLGVEARILPATDNLLATMVQVAGGEWLSFQDYFVKRSHADEVISLEYDGITAATPAPGVLDAIAGADLVVIAPSNPPLSIWPILDIPGIGEAVADAQHVVAVSPLFSGKALKGPADRVLASLGLAGGTAGILQAYEGLLSALVIDTADVADVRLSTDTTRVVATDTRMQTAEQGRAFADWLFEEIAQ